MEKPNEARELSQTVQFSKEHGKTIHQSVYFDPAEDWVILNHDGHETPLSRENFLSLMDLGRRAISVVVENEYTHLKNLKLKDSAPLLEAMTNEQILELMREDSKHVQFKYWDVTGFTKLLVQEIFKRSKIGYKSIHQLSRTQQAFIENLNIYQKKSYK